MGGAIIQERQLIQIFPSKRGDYLREAFNRGIYGYYLRNVWGMSLVGRELKG